MSETSLSPIITSLEATFSIFNNRFYNNELQAPVITVSPDRTKGAYGWCTAYKAWDKGEPKKITEFTKEAVEAAKKDGGFYEINICAEHLTRPYEQTCATLLHEMVHLYCLQHGIQDTSRGGSYHNKRFKEVAEKHGLAVDKDKKYGWTLTTLNEEGKWFVSTLTPPKFEIYRKTFPKIPGAKKNQSTRKYVCPCCGMIIRATKEVNVICGDCNVQLEEEA